jgi:hypothetical protein
MQATISERFPNDFRALHRLPNLPRARNSYHPLQSPGVSASRIGQYGKYGQFRRCGTSRKMKNLISRLFGSRSAAPARYSGRVGLEVSRMTEDNPATIEDGSDNALRRQLVHVLMRDVLRRHGIPSALIECQMLVVASRRRGPGMYVRLVLRQWDERLVRYAFAFQNALMADILRFEPAAAEWLHGVSWQFEFEGTCPYAPLPDKSFWQSPAAAGASTEAAASPAPTAPSLTPTELATAALQANAARRAALTSADSSPGYATTTHRHAATDLIPLSAKQVDTKKSEEAEDLERLFAIRDRELSRPSGGDIAQVGYEETQPWPL